MHADSPLPQPHTPSFPSEGKPVSLMPLSQNGNFIPKNGNKIILTSALCQALQQRGQGWSTDFYCVCIFWASWPYVLMFFGWNFMCRSSVTEDQKTPLLANVCSPCGLQVSDVEHTSIWASSPDSTSGMEDNASCQAWHCDVLTLGQNVPSWRNELRWSRSLSIGTDKPIHIGHLGNQCSRGGHELSGSASWGKTRQSWLLWVPFSSLSLPTLEAHMLEILVYFCSF